MSHTHQDADWRYWFDFIFFPALAMAVILYDARSLAWFGWAALGFAVWTFVEYWTHRTLLHIFFWHGTHERHHKAPAEFVIFPVWYVPAFFLACMFAMPLHFFAGFTLGYVWFLSLHHMLHHWDLKQHTWLHRYAIWHNRHHKLDNVNYGITTPVWDWMFGTFR